MFDKMRGKEPSPDFSARRAAHYERAFGQSRPSQIEPKAGLEGGGVKKAKSKPQLSPSKDITVNQQVEVEVSGERQWLGLGDDYGYGLGYFRRERSEGLSVQIEKELQQRGYGAGKCAGLFTLCTPISIYPQMTLTVPFKAQHTDLGNPPKATLYQFAESVPGGETSTIKYLPLNLVTLRKYRKATLPHPFPEDFNQSPNPGATAKLNTPCCIKETTISKIRHLQVTCTRNHKAPTYYPNSLEYPPAKAGSALTRMFLPR
jgi:hypothetical protein